MSSAAPFIYTTFITASHIIVTGDEPEIVLSALYKDMLSGNIKSIDVVCDFNQLNDILYCHGDGTDVLTEQIAYAVASDVLPLTIDVSEQGGLECNHLLYCLQLVQSDEVEEQPTHQYFLRAYIQKDPAVDYDTMLLPKPGQDKTAYYLSVLRIQYRFYLHFINELNEEEALFYASLNEPVVFLLAKSVYEGMGDAKMENGK